MRINFFCKRKHNNVLVPYTQLELRVLRTRWKAIMFPHHYGLQAGTFGLAKGQFFLDPRFGKAALGSSRRVHYESLVKQSVNGQTLLMGLEYDASELEKRFANMLEAHKESKPVVVIDSYSGLIDDRKPTEVTILKGRTPTGRMQFDFDKHLLATALDQQRTLHK